MFDTYVLSTAPWENPSAWSDKLVWVKKHLGQLAYKRLILSHHKNLNSGDFLVDDRTRNGVDKFQASIFILERQSSRIGQPWLPTSNGMQPDNSTKPSNT